MNDNKIFQILNSKWFMLGLGILMILLLPTTYGNVKIVMDAGEMSRLFWVPLVFIINVITAVLALYKFASKAFTKQEQKQEW